MADPPETQKIVDRQVKARTAIGNAAMKIGEVLNRIPGSAAGPFPGDVGIEAGAEGLWPALERVTVDFERLADLVKNQAAELDRLL